MSRKSLGGWVAMVVLVGSMACVSEDPPSGPTPDAPEITLVAPDTVVVGLDVTLTAREVTGGEIAGVEVAWSTTPAGAATVSTDGVLRALQIGFFTVTAQVGARRATRALVARAPEVVSLTIAPIADLIPGDTLRPAVTAVDRLGGTPPVTPVWTADTARFALLSPGVWRVRSIGAGAIEARVGAVTARRDLTVALGPSVGVRLASAPGVVVGTPVRWAVEEVDRRGNVRSASGPAYAVSRSPDVVVVAAVADSVRLAGVRPGTVWVVAGRGGFMDSSLVTVTLPPIRTLTATTGSARVDWMSGATVVIEAEDATGRRMPAGAFVSVTPIGFEAGFWRWELTADSALHFSIALPPFTASGRRDQGVAGQVVFAAGGQSDTLTLTPHYRRPSTMSWALGPAVTLEVREVVPTEPVLRDSVGVVVSVSRAAGLLELPVSSDANVLLPRVPSNLYGVSPGTAQVTQHYREGDGFHLVRQTVATVVAAPPPVDPPAPPPPTGDASPIGAGYIRVHPVQPLTANVRAAITAAVSRLEAVISATPLSPIAVSVPANTCLDGFPAVNGTIDGVYIQISIEPYDGVGGVLGAAGPCGLRGSALGRPFLGVVFLDAADVAGLATSGRLADVVAHEFLHVLGVGTVWDLLGLAADPTPVDPYYFGAGARAAYADLGGAGNVPLENTGGAGTAGSHWRESVFRSELMTGYLSPNTNPLSRLTVAGLADLGYTVNVAAAEGYTLGQLLQALTAGPTVPINEVIVRPRMITSPGGATTEIRSMVPVRRLAR